MATTLLQHVRVLDPASNTDQVTDVLMVDGIFRAIAPEVSLGSSEAEIIDATGQVLMPGLVDLYSHSCEPGYEARETLTALMAGAIAGGVTRLGILPDTAPPLDHPGTIRHLLDLACELPLSPQPYLLPWAALTQGINGHQMTDLASLAREQPVTLAGFADGRPLADLVLVRRLLDYLKPLQCAVALWPCDSALAAGGVAREGALAWAAGVPVSPVAAETAALATLLELVQETGTPVHIMRISTARSVDLIAQAKAAGLPVTASTSWMHLLWSTQALSSYDPNLHLQPPLGNPVDQAALIAGVKAGVIDAIAIDHSPYTYEEKTVAFQQAPPGVIGLELAFVALWQHLVALGDWSPLELVQAMSRRPAICLGLQPSVIARDHPVEAFLFDPKAEWQVVPGNLRSPALNTPFLHQSLKGRVLQVWNATNHPLHRL